MNISYNWLKKYVDFDFTPSQIDDALTMLGVEVESYSVLRNKYAGFVIGEVLHKEKHPDSDHLSLCNVSVGNREFPIVCGAPNVAAGQKIVFGQIGATVPSAGIKLEKRKIRGHYSEGMICSQSELELGDDHSGIWVLPDDAPVGIELVKYLDIDDIILEISLTPNKADCASHIGIARELAAVLQQQIAPLKTKVKEGKVPTSNEVSLDVKDTHLCPRYAARVITNVRNSESPQWLKQALLKIGLRPRNVVVDVTNYVLMDLGQPLHSFDLDKVAGRKIVVKNGFNTKFMTLDGKERQLTPDMLMICDKEKPIAIAGVMGGQNSEIDDTTTNVVLESAFFNPSSIRKTSKKLALQTDASYRFERGCDIDIVIPAIDLAAKMIAELTGGAVLKGIVENYPNPIAEKQIEFRYERAKNIIGAEISNIDMKHIFKYLGFKTTAKDSYTLIVTVPNRRVDIFDEIDLVEEIARVANYDNIPANFASNIDFQRDTIPATLRPLPLRNLMRQYLSNSGFVELLTPNIIDPASASLTANKFIRIENPLGEEMSILRPNMLPSMLKVVSFNIRQGNADLKLFETGKIFLPQTNFVNSFIEGIDEREQLILALTGNSVPRQWGFAERPFDFYDIKGIVVELCNHLRLPKYKIRSITSANTAFDSNSAEIFVDKKLVGHIGGISGQVLKQYDIDFPVFIATIDITTLSDVEIQHPQYQPVSSYPVVKRDLAFIVSEQYSTSEMRKCIREKGTALLKSVSVFDVYKGKGIAQGQRSIGFELSFASAERTLVDTEIEQIIANVVVAMEKNFVAVLRK
ncbi:MAG: phenylalanine--tRNA ligase subunit beta [Ignavibacteria bacterium]|jgi:phenylalanyl-tRNA synthetase beta chain|nr:phenylalanine--tRNA ligase subunit beta [Ignavibacteria bacterium]